MRTVYNFFYKKLYTVAVLSAMLLAYGEASAVIISSYRTSVESQDSSVKANIKMASSKIDGVVIFPGEVFSFNKIVGEANAANGYMMGRVLYEGAALYEPGGGVCQVSSTLFNGFLLSGCIIIERHKHMQPVSYVPLGLDATIRYGKKDLKIKT